MPSEFRSPRNLASWLELDYFHRRHLFRGWWGRLLLVAAVAGLACLGVMLAWAGNRTFQAGPLSAPHALFNDDCRLCHQDHWAPLTRMWRGDSIGSVPDSACLQCHAGSHHNPPHAERGRCVSCHREHHGHAALVRVDDRRCVECHRDLKRSDGGTPDFHPRVVSFDDGEGHPPFRLWSGGKEKDPGTVRFNHKVHLVEAGVPVIDLAQWRKQEEELRKKGVDPGTRLPPARKQKLDCADCHQMDPAGRYMLPINHEQHCQKCHPLSIPIVGAWKDGELARLARDFALEPLPHPKKGQGPESVRAALRDRLARFISGPAGGRFLTTPEEGPPGRLPFPAADAPRPEKEYAWVGRHLARTEEVLFAGAGGCGYCHTVRQPVAVGTRRPHTPPRPDRLPVLAAPDIPARWWKHATFRHDSHRPLACVECHDAKNSVLTSDVLLPGRETCLKCHNRRASASARADCMECHVYHDPKLQAEAREKGRLTIDALRGR